MNKEWLIDELDEIVYVSDPETYELLYVNRPGRVMMGLGESEYMGKMCYKVLQGFDQPCDFCTNAWIEKDHFTIWEHSNPHLNRHFIVKDKLVEWDGRLARMEFAVDVTEKESVSRALTEKLKIENTMVECISSMITAGNLEDGVNLVLESIGNFYQADRAYIFEFDLDRKVCSNTYEWCNENIAPQLEMLQDISINTISRWMNNFKEKKSIVTRDLEEIRELYPEEYQILSIQNIHSLFTVPLIIEDSLVGYIGVDNPRYSDSVALMDSLSYLIVSEVFKRRLQKKLQFMGYHDLLTGLQNRNSYMEYLAENREVELFSLGVLVADINGLKQLNQTYGHGYGDGAVQKTADIFRQNFGGQLIYRLNGDEFLVLCENIPRNEFISRIQSARADFSQIENNGASVGYTWSDMDIDIPALVSHADELMFINKQDYYKNSDAISKHHRPAIRQDLLKLIEEHRFMMYLQPKVDIKTGAVVGAEALVRLNHPSYGLVQPDKFIPLLEKSHNIRYVDFFMCEEVCKTLERWKREGVPLIPISFNFSRVTMLETDLMKVLDDIYSRYDVPKEYIEIEITESMGEMERETISEIGSKIRDKGFAISLDDFGSKYTSMSMLTIMKFNVLKLDRSLVNDIVKNHNSRIVVRHVVEMCRELGVYCVAEGVENTEQLALLEEICCDFAQGFLFSRPVPLSDFEEKYLRNRS